MVSQTQNRVKKVIGQIVEEFPEFEGRIVEMTTDGNWGTVIISVEKDWGENRKEKRRFILNPTLPNFKLPRGAAPEHGETGSASLLKLRQERTLSREDLFGVIKFNNGAGKFSKSMAVRSMNDFSKFLGSSIKVTDNGEIIVNEIEEPKKQFAMREVK
ncbi:MAG TPA: hypothetical protein VMC41_02430 [Candidatus Nanoarchaeia archaeon]|nr:hypothetical protein [Candidatus Nanoarchaeia archaeon]